MIQVIDQFCSCVYVDDEKSYDLQMPDDTRTAIQILTCLRKVARLTILCVLVCSEIEKL